MIIPFTIPETLPEEQTIYMPAELCADVADQLEAQGAMFKRSVIHMKMFFEQMPVPAEIPAWKQRFEADGYYKSPVEAYDALTVPYDVEKIYEYSKKFFGPTIDPAYKAELDDIAESNRAIVEAQEAEYEKYEANATHYPDCDPRRVKT